jgi:hypothetical protein
MAAAPGPKDRSRGRRETKTSDVSSAIARVGLSKASAAKTIGRGAPMSSRGSAHSARGSTKGSAAGGDKDFALDPSDAKKTVETLPEVIAKIFKKSYSPGRELRGVLP